MLGEETDLPTLCHAQLELLNRRDVPTPACTEPVDNTHKSVAMVVTCGCGDGVSDGGKWR